MGQPELKKADEPEKRSTVRKEIFLSGITLSSLMILIFGFLLSYYLYESEMNRARGSINKSNQTIAVFIEAYFQEITNTLNAISDNPEVRDVFVLPVEAKERVLAHYRAFARANKNIVYIYSGYENGMLVINDYIPPEDYDPVKRPWYVAAVEASPGISVGVPYQEIKTREWLISTSKLLDPDPNGTRGVLTIDCSIEEIAQLLMEKQVFNSEYSFVTSGNGEVIIHHMADLIGTSFQEIVHRIGLATEAEFSYRLDNVDYIAFYRIVKSTGWYVITVIEQKEVVYPIIFKMLVYLFLIVLLAVLLGLAQSYFLGRRFAEPLVELTKEMKRMVKGEKSEGWLYHFPDNEIGFMAKSIGQLAQEEMRRKTRELEIIIESTSDGIFVVDNTGRIIRTNTNFNRMWELNIKDSQEAGYQEVVDHIRFLAAEPDVLVTMFDDFSENNRTCTEQLQLKDNRTFEIYSCPFMENDRIIGRLWSFRDITERKSAENTLLESEARYRNLLEVAPVGIAVYCQGKIAFVNTAGSQLLGAGSETEIINRPISKIIHPDRLHESEDRLQRILKGEKGLFPVENVYLKLDGTPIDVEVMATAIPYEGKTAVQVIVKDITARKRVEEELRLNERRMATLLELSQIAERSENAITDFALERAVEITGSRIGYLAFVNEDETVMIMYSWSKFAMAECNAALKPKVYPVATTGLWGEAVRQRRPVITNDYTAPNPLKKGYPDGHVHVHRHMNLPLIDEGKIVLVAGVGNKKDPYDEQDVQQLNLLMDGVWKTIKTKRIERALRESEECFSRAFKSSPAPLVISEIDTGLFIDVNDRWIEMLGYTRQEQIGRTSKEVGIWVDSGERDRIVRKLQEKGYFKDEPINFKNKSGDEIQALWSAEAITFAGRQVMLSMIYDETERKKSEKERENLQIQLLQAQKMESVGRLAGGVAHDFNNMLGVILGHTELALEKMEPGQPLYTDLKEIQKAAGRSADLTRQLLGFARKQTVAPKILDLNETIEKMFKMLRRLIGEDISLTWLPGRNLWQVNIDPSQIEQILVNLCVNARDAVCDKGKITIETGNVTIEQSDYSDQNGWVAGDYVLLAISDNGCGMDKQTLDKLFEPFFTTKGIGKGTGLGLATVYGIVKQNDGIIKVYSEPDHGTTFKIFLPRHRVNQEQGMQVDLSIHDFNVRETVLLVEDEPAILKLTTLMLESQGFTVIAASSPDEAIRLARGYPGDIHLLMTDVVMPQMNGRELAEKLMKFYPNLKRLFMSGYTADVIAHHGVLDEGVNFIQKPFSKKDLAASVKAVLDSQQKI